MALPLTGRVVVELVRTGASEVTRRAVALAGRMALDLGAEVVKVVPAGGCPLQRAPPLVVGSDGQPIGAASVFLDAGKRLLAAGERLPGHIALVTDAETGPAGSPGDAAGPAPVVVGVAHGLPACPGMADADATDTAVLAASGILDLVGDPDRPPIPLGGHQASYVAGLAAFSGLVAALAAVERGAPPQTVSVSALEACLWSNWKSYAERLYMGTTPTRMGAASEWHVLPCADGFATFIYLEKDWPAVVRYIGEARLGAPPFDTRAGRRAHMADVLAIVGPWYRTRTRAQIFARAKETGLPISPVISVPELAHDAQYAALHFLGAPATPMAAPAARVPSLPTTWDGARLVPRRAGTTRAGPEAVNRTDGPHCAAPAAGSPAPDSRPLAGVRVLDLGIITAGASTSALLADLGADVIKVESPAYIDPFRGWDRALGAPDWWNRSRFFDFTNRNKRGLAVDLKQEAGRELLLELVAKADVVVENFRRGVLDRLGLGWDVLKTRNPRLVLCSVTSQGETGPDAGAASYGSTLEATSGLADLTRDADGVPRITGVLLNYPDQIVSIHAAGMVTLAVMEQRRTGRGARLDVSQRELASFLVGEHILASTAGEARQPGADAASRAAAPIVRDASGHWHVAVGAARVPVANGDDMLAAVEAGTVAMAFARTPAGAAVKGMPFALPAAPMQVTRAAPALGEHNGEVLHELLGLDAAAVARLEAAGIVGTRPRG